MYIKVNIYTTIMVYEERFFFIKLNITTAKQAFKIIFWFFSKKLDKL